MTGQAQEHPSYGMISASHVTSSHGQGMYGSGIKHSAYIVVSISPSQFERSCGENRYFESSRGQIIQIRMSEGQFARFITSMNTKGVPCTIERLHGKAVEPPPYKNEADIVKKELADRAQQLASLLRDTQEMIGTMSAPGSKLTKADVSTLKLMVDKAVREIGQNLPFLTEVFEETVDGIVDSAKIDIENYAARVLKSDPSPLALRESE